METSNTDVNLVVLHAHNDRWGLGPIETINSGHNDAVVNAKRTTDEGWDPYRLVIMMLISLFCMHTTTGEIRDPWRLVILALIMRFSKQKTTGEVWDP